MQSNNKIILAVVILIIISGLAWILLANKSSEEPIVNNSIVNTNTSLQVNTNVNNSVMINLVFGQVSTSCLQDEDCQIINREKDYTSCCETPECPGKTEDEYIAVNLESFNNLVAEVKTQQICPSVPCPQYMPCEPQNNNDVISRCIENVCIKTADNSDNNGSLTLYQYSGLLADVSGGSGLGEAKANFENGKYDLLATFENLPDLEGTDYYEGWIVRSDSESVVSTGVAVKENGIYINTYTTDQDLTDHDYYVLTLEPDDDDPAPATHILEGQMSI